MRHRTNLTAPPLPLPLPLPLPQVWDHTLKLLLAPENLGTPLRLVAQGSAGGRTNFLQPLKTALQVPAFTLVSARPDRTVTQQQLSVAASNLAEVDQAARGALTALPPALRRTVLVLRVKAGVAKLARVGEALQPHNSPLVPLTGTLQGVEQLEACDALARDIITLYALDTQAGVGVHGHMSVHGCMGVHGRVEYRSCTCIHAEAAQRCALQSTLAAQAAS